MKLQDQLRFINDSEYKPEPYNPPGKYIKGFIISNINDNKSMYATRKAISSIIRSKSEIDYMIYPSSIPTTVELDLAKITYLDNPSTLPWTWPTSKSQEGLCMQTGVYKKYFDGLDQKLLISNTVSHMLLWQQCIDMNQPILIMHPNVKFMRKFSYDRMSEDIAKLQEDQGISNELYRDGIIGIGSNNNDIIESNEFNRIMERKGNKRGFHRIPYMLGPRFTVPGYKNIVPFPSHHCYIITPSSAKKLFSIVQNIGLRPVWCLISREHTPWALFTFPRYAVGTEFEYSPIYSPRVNK